MKLTDQLTDQVKEDLWNLSTETIYGIALRNRLGFLEGRASRDFG